MIFRTKRLICSLCGLGVLSTALQAQPADSQPVSLQQAIGTALDQAYTLKGAMNSRQIAANNNNYGEAGRYPTVTFNVNSQNTYNNINNPTSFLNGAQVLSVGATGNLDATWVLFDGFKVRINKQRLSLLEAQTEGNARVILENLVGQTTKAYLQVQVQRERWQKQGEVLALSRDKIAYIEARRDYGQAVAFDRLQVNDAYLNDSIQWEMQRMGYALATQNLAMAMGLAPDAQVTAGDSLVYELPDYTWEELQASLRQNNQQIKNLQVVEMLAQVDIDLRKSSLYPRLSMSAGASDQVGANQVNGKQPLITNDWKFANTFTGYVNFAFTYTIFNGGKLRRAVENAELQREIVAFNTKDTERNLSHQLRILWERYEQQRQIYALTQQLNANAEQNVAIAEEKFKSGTLNFFDLRTIQSNYIRSVNAMQDAFLNAKTTEIDFLLLSGMLVRDQEE